MIVPKGYSALPEDLLPLRNQGHCRTVTLIADKHTEAVESASFLLPELLGDYVAQVRLAPPGCEPVTLVNVHASPKPVMFDEAPFGAWRRRAEVHVYYSDVISSELAVLAKTGGLIAAGFNEAHAWDLSHNTTMSAEFFDRLANQGLVDVTARAWPQEVTTQTRHQYQVDRIFATSDVDVSVKDAAEAVGLDDGCSDHFPLAFSLTLHQADAA